MVRLPRRAYWGLGLLVALAVGGVLVVVAAGALSRGQPERDAEPGTGTLADAEGGALAVRIIRPKGDPSFTLCTEAPAQVMPYEWADLEAQTAGRVEFIRKAEGSHVKAGELLVKIAVPDLDEEVRQKESFIRQREADLRLAQANEKIAQVEVTVAAKNLEVKRADVDASLAMESYRRKEYNRFAGLVADRAATEQMVEEHELAYQAAAADAKRARAAVEKAKADLLEAQAKLEAAQADINLKQELIAVARKDRDRAQALANYSKITAPFDGVITDRKVNRGSFVQNATTARTEPLLRVERRDIVTIVMKVPDTFAPLVNNETEAVIEMSELPGQAIHGKVTRFAPTLESKTNDHSMLVEVDLFNGSQPEYEAFLDREKASGYADLKEGPLPLMPKVSGTGGERRLLLPGMYGQMTLVFNKLEKTFLVPSDAIVHEGGTPFIYLVRNGKAHKVPVQVQVDDQKLAKIALLTRTSAGEIRHELTGEEQVIYSNLSELTDGQPVNPIPVEFPSQN
jgi:multidrug resistance efflux pump